MPPRGVKKGTKRARQYEHVKESVKDQGKSETTAEEIAARTVNKEKARHGGDAGGGRRVRASPRRRGAAAALRAPRLPRGAAPPARHARAGRDPGADGLGLARRGTRVRLRRLRGGGRRGRGAGPAREL